MNVILRKLRKEDAAISWKWRNDPEVWELTGRTFTNHVSKEIEEQWIKNINCSSLEARFAICVNKDKKYIGNVQLTNINNGSAIFHIFIGDKNFWGVGVAKVATKLALNYGFDMLNLKKISLSVCKSNVAAIAVYKHNGFKDDGHAGSIITMTISKDNS